MVSKLVALTPAITVDPNGLCNGGPQTIYA